MIRNMYRRVLSRFPALGRWSEGDWDRELPAFVVSVLVHSALLISLAFVGRSAGGVLAPRVFQADRAASTSLPELSRVEFQDLDQSDKPPTLDAKAGSFAPDVAPVQVAMPGSESRSMKTPEGVARSVEVAALDVRRATAQMAPTASMLGTSVSIQGNGVEHVGTTEGGVDRVATEILRRLEKGRTLVVWAFDASGSLQAERERLTKHIETVYTHIGQLDEGRLSSDGGLLTAVVSFGHDRKVMTEPTADLAEVSSAIKAVGLDTTGIESTFQTTIDIVRRWGHYRDANNQHYRTMIIIVTDEVGDDETKLEEAVETASRAKVPVYVLGNSALFGRADGFMNYTDPKTKKTYYNLPVRQGPESALVETVKLPFWYEGQQLDYMDSSFGPYALSRLAGATGGIYFVARLGNTRIGFEPSRMREYHPDWISADQYQKAVLRHPIRQAVLLAAAVTQQNLPGMPRLSFSPVENGFKDEMERGQEVAARTAYTVDEALRPILAAAKERDRETSRRWQAHYDLARGRLLAVKIRCYEYNWACALMKKDAPKFKKPDSNAWRLVPDEEIHFNAAAQKAGKQAKELLEKLVKEHAGTPWALLAQRELRHPFGFKWVETHVNPPPKRNPAEPKKKATPKMEKPAELPKL